jgi:polygalacturonase
LIALKECRDVHIRDVTLVDAPNYNISLLGCDRVVIVGLTILNGYADGIDPDCCRNVRISHCRIESRDDAVAIKASFALGARRATEDVEVTACDLSTMHNGLKLGTESTGDFRRVVFSNCTITGRRHPWKGHLSCGVALETVDGGHLEDVRVSDVRMADVRTPIFVRLGARGWAPPGVPASMLTNVSISNVVASGAIMASSITGIPRQPVSGISLANVRAVVTGRSTGYRAPEDVPELPHTYPDAYMFRDLPAYGFYCRHVRGLVLDGIDVGIERPDARSAVMLDDVRNASLQAIRAKSPAGAEPLIHLRSVRGCVVRGVEPQEGTRTFVRLSGADTTGIRLVGNDLSRVDRVAMMDTEVSPSALRVESTEALSRARGV